MWVLGFCILDLLNLALFARQAWRVLHDPNLLSPRIMKSVYYPSTSIMDASLGSHPS